MNKEHILNAQQFDLTIQRLCYQLIEEHNDFSQSIIIGLQPRGIHLSKRLQNRLEQILKNKIVCGNLDVTFYRDDFRRREQLLYPKTTNIDFIIENKKVILIDDVLYTGRTIRAGIEALLTFGRPQKIELLVLIDRRFNRDLPIQANYVGKTVDALSSERVSVEWEHTEGEDKVILYSPTTSSSK